MYEIFNKMMDAYNTKNQREFEAYARMLVDNDYENPFPMNTIEHKLFFKAKQYCRKWRACGIDMRSSRRNMIEMIRQIAERKPENPYTQEIKKEVKRESKKQEPKKQEVKKEIKKETPKETKEEDEDIRYVMAQMVDAHNHEDNEAYEMYATHLMDIAKENPFLLGTDEYELFSTMKACFDRKPPNMRKVFVTGKQRCSLINNTVLEEKPKETILGVVPDEKKSWLKFLFPWKKEGESDDSPGIN